MDHFGTFPVNVRQNVSNPLNEQLTSDTGVSHRSFNDLSSLMTTDRFPSLSSPLQLISLSSSAGRFLLLFILHITLITYRHLDFRSLLYRGLDPPPLTGIFLPSIHHSSDGQDDDDGILLVSLAFDRSSASAGRQFDTMDKSYFRLGPHCWSVCRGQMVSSSPGIQVASLSLLERENAD